MATITIKGVTTAVSFYANAADSVKYMNGLKTDLLSHTLSIALHVLKSSTTSAFTNMDMFFAETLDKTIRRFIPMQFNRDLNKWELNKERADKIRDELGLERGQFDFDQLCEAITLQVAKAEAEAKAKADAEAAADAELMKAQGITEDELKAKKELEALIKYIERKTKTMNKVEAFKAINAAFPEFGAMYMQMRNQVTA